MLVRLSTEGDRVYVICIYATSNIICRFVHIGLSHPRAHPIVIPCPGSDPLGVIHTRDQYYELGF